MLLEQIAASDGFALSWTEIDQELCAGDMGVSASEMREIVNFCCKLGILDLENERLCCQELTARLQPMLKKRLSMRDTAKTPVSESESVISAAETPVSESESVHSIYSKSKAKSGSTPERASIRTAPPPPGGNEKCRSVELQALQVQCGHIPADFVAAWHMHYESVGWLDGSGKAIYRPEMKILSHWNNNRRSPHSSSRHEQHSRNDRRSEKPQSDYARRIALTTNDIIASASGNSWITGTSVGNEHSPAHG
jgi:hypothetical protein